MLFRGTLAGINDVEAAVPVHDIASVYYFLKLDGQTVIRAGAEQALARSKIKDQDP